MQRRVRTFVRFTRSHTEESLDARNSMGGWMTCIIKGEVQETNSPRMSLSGVSHSTLHLRDSSPAERTTASVGGAARTRILAPKRMQGDVRCVSPSLLSRCTQRIAQRQWDIEVRSPLSVEVRGHARAPLVLQRVDHWDGRSEVCQKRWGLALLEWRRNFR